ncbi:MAG: hypothetical protein ABI652_07875 [Acidobacteriota bacterium]
MKRLITWSALFIVAVLASPSLLADVKTRDKSTFSLEGVMGSMVRMFGGSAARDGITATVAVKGDRKSSINDNNGQIVDLTEQKLYTLDVKKKEYKVTTFAELRAAYEKAKADAAKQAKDMKPEEKQQVEDAGKQLEFEIDIKETGEKKSIAGYDTHEVVMTITGHEKGKALEEGGGIVLTNNIWMGPKIAALDESRDFELRYAKAVYGESFAADMQQMAAMVAMYPAFTTMSTKMQTEGKKLQGTALSSSTTFESVRSAEQMKAAADQQQARGGGGLSGAFAKKLMGNRGQPTQRTKVMTSTHDLLSIDTTVTAADVAIPAGFKEKK